MERINDATTYIIATKSNEFYCGKTNNVYKRLQQHRKEKYPHWFNKKLRKEWLYVMTFNGDCEKQIKRAGVKVIANIISNLKEMGVLL